MYKKALLINQEGKEFTGWTTEDFHPSTGELIFNTAMTGFVEILSDPSYVNQIITFTSPILGIMDYLKLTLNLKDQESMVRLELVSQLARHPGELSNQ